MKTRSHRRRMPLTMEKNFWSRDFKYVIGLDEAGRGPLAGPVAAGAVAIIAEGDYLRSLESLQNTVNDSKQLSRGQRQASYGILTGHSHIVWGCALASVEEIDKINILQATKLAMKRALAKVVRGLGGRVGRIACVLDGNFYIDSDLSQTPVVGGDGKVFSVAAASIIAKVTRDRIMERLDKKYPDWDFASNKGYPTPGHLRHLLRHAPTTIHRKTFGPVRDVLRRLSEQDR